MMNRLIVFCFCAFAIAQIGASELDDSLAAYIEKLDQLLASTKSSITVYDDKITTTEVSDEHTKTTFLSQGEGVRDSAISVLNQTATEKLITAITNNRGVSAYTCIINKLNAAANNIIKEYENFQNSILAAEESQNLASSRLSNALISLAVQSIYESSKSNIELCVEEACFENNLSIITGQFATVVYNINENSTSLDSSRTKFNQELINHLNNQQQNTRSEQTTGENQINKC